jgi:hypothetical protein
MLNKHRWLLLIILVALLLIAAVIVFFNERIHQIEAMP